MKISHCIALLTALLTASIIADTIILKTGVKYQGKVISQDEESYLCEIYVTKSIRDERRIPKDQVQEIIKKSEDAKAITHLQSLVPTPDRLTLDAYEKRIKAAKSFLTKFPKSKHIAEAKKIMATLQEEQKAIADGGIKLGGQIISADDMEANAYDIDARILFQDLKKYSANGNYQRALRKWEILEKEYSKSSAYHDSLGIISRILKSYKVELTSLINSHEAREAKRKAALESLEEGDRERTVSYLAEKHKAYENLNEREKKELRTRWLTIDPYHKKALDYNLRSINTVMNSLRNTKSAKTELAGPTYRGVWSALAEGNLEQAEKLIKQLESMRIPEKYTSLLAQQLEQKKANKAAEEKAAKERAEKEKIEKEAAAETSADES
ncbi:MAG: hypothetical protein KJO79_05085 [Verrucomicrobiae bacterium]|nr:hypothetical protein [Verrucomicrobiae bacterium]NNJ86533.1 hypothetical protein [Akkermansiaceae bacterium]